MDEIKQIREYVTAVHAASKADHDLLIRVCDVIFDIEKRFIALEKRNEVRPWFSNN